MRKPMLSLFLASIFLFVSASVAQTISDVVIARARYETTLSDQSISEIFESIPSVEQMKSVIQKGDTLSLAKLNQNFLQGKTRLNCKQQARYLDRLNGFLRTAVWWNDEQISSTTFSLNQAKENIDFARLNVRNIQKKISDLGVEQARSQLGVVVGKLQAQYDEFNNASDKLIGLEVEFDRTKSLIENCTKVNAETRQIANQKKQSLEGLNNQISELEAKIKQLNQKRSQVLAELKAALESIAIIQDQLEKLQNKLKLIEGQIKYSKSSRDALAKQAIQLETDVATLKKDLKELEDKQHGLLAQLDIRQGKLFDMENVLGKERALEDLKDLNAGLASMIPKFQSHSYNTYYFCNMERQLITSEIADSLTGFSVEGRDLQNYLRNSYGNSVGLPSLSFSTTLFFKIVDLFSQEWMQVHGSMFNSSALNEQTLSFAGDQTCSASIQPTSSGVGVITDISHRSIRLTSFLLGELSISLGACTRMEATENPRVGQTGYFRGNFDGKNWSVQTMTIF